MLPLLNKRLLLELSPTSLRLVPPQGEPHQQTVTPASWWSSLEQLLDQPAWRGAQLSVVLSNQLVCLSVLNLDPKLKDPSARLQFANHSLSQLFGGNSANWESRLFVNPTGETALVAGIEKSWLQQLTALCQKQQYQLHSVVPQLSRVFNFHYRALKREDGWLVIYEAGYSLLLLLQQGQLIYVSGQHHHNLAELPQLLARENLLSPAGSATQSFRLYNTATTSTLSGVLTLPHVPSSKALAASPMALDFQQQNNHNRRAGWLLLLVGVVLLAEMLFSYQQLLDEIDSLPLQQDLLQQKPRQSALAPQDEANWQAMQTQLQRPWSDFFSGLESIQNPNIAILSLQHHPQNQTIQLQGEARDYAALLTLVAELNNTPPFADATLLHHETRRDQPQQPVAFTLTLRWVQTK